MSSKNKQMSKQQSNTDRRPVPTIAVVALAIIVASLSLFWKPPSEEHASHESPSPAAQQTQSNDDAEKGKSTDAQGDTEKGAPQNATDASQANVETATVARVVDGDTIKISVRSETLTCRLIGIDAPESAHENQARNCEEGREASAHTKELLPEGAVVYLQRDISDTDQYGRLLRYVWLTQPSSDPTEQEITSSMVNAQLVAEGWACANSYKPDIRFQSTLNQLESKASSPFSSGRTAREATKQGRS